MIDLAPLHRDDQADITDVRAVVTTLIKSGVTDQEVSAAITEQHLNFRYDYVNVTSPRSFYAKFDSIQDRVESIAQNAYQKCSPDDRGEAADSKFSDDIKDLTKQYPQLAGLDKDLYYYFVGDQWLSVIPHSGKVHYSYMAFKEQGVPTNANRLCTLLRAKFGH